MDSSPMKQWHYQTAYEILEVPDRSDTTYMGIAGGDIKDGIAWGFAQLTRTLVTMPPRSVELAILYRFRPARAGKNRQSRLSLYLRLSAQEGSTFQSLQCLITGGMISRFYGLHGREVPILAEKNSEATCWIKRVENFIKPLYSCDFNANIPESYYCISPFVPNPDNDGLLLDRILDKVTEPVDIELSLAPVDTAELLSAHTAYLAQLHSVNRSWYHDEETDYDFLSDAEQRPHWEDRTASQLKPLHYQDPLADDLLRQQRRFHETLFDPHLFFEFKVMAPTKAVACLVASTLCNSGFGDGKYQLHMGHSAQIEIPERFRSLSLLGHIATIEELAGIFILPSASFASPLCIRKSTDPHLLKVDRTLFFGYDLQGFAESDEVPRNIPLDYLCKHLSCFGMSGSGKTTLIMHLLIQLFEHDIRFLVIESAKKEYRILKSFKNHHDPRLRKLARHLQVYTPGAEAVSPLRLNPLCKPDPIGLFKHIGNLRSCIEASIPVACGSLPALLFEAFECVYEKSARYNRVPIMADLVAEIETVLSEKGYSPQTKSDMQTVIEVRVGSLIRGILGQVFQCRQGLDIAQLMQAPAVLELDALPAMDICVLTLFLINAIREHAEISDNGANGLRHVIIVEEAHNILGSSMPSLVSEDMADPQAAAANDFSRLLLEMRRLGIGIVLCDQHPSNLHVAASKSVATKISFRQTHADDCDELEKGMLLGRIGSRDIARLGPGTAYLFTEGYHGPRKIRTENLHDRFDVSHVPSDSQLKELIAEERWFRDARQNRIAVELIQFSEAVSEYNAHLKNVGARFRWLLQQYISQLDQPNLTVRPRRWRTLFVSMKRLRGELIMRYRRLIKGPWRRFRYLEHESADGDPEIVNLGSKIFHGFTDISRPLTGLLMDKIDKYLKNISLKYTQEVWHG